MDCGVASTLSSPFQPTISPPICLPSLPSGLQLAYKVPTTVTRPDGTTCTLEGLEGFDRECLSIFLEASAVRADQAATKPDEKPPVQPIRVQRAFQQCQVGGNLAGIWPQVAQEWQRTVPHSCWQARHGSMQSLPTWRPQSGCCMPALQGDLVDLGEGRDPAFRYVLVYVELLTRRVWLRPLRSKSALECVREVSCQLVIERMMKHTCVVARLGAVQACTCRRRAVSGGQSAHLVKLPRSLLCPLPAHPTPPQIYNIWMDTQVPAVLQTDNGKEFGNLLEELCGHFGVRLIHGSVGHPQSQGATERTNQTFKDIISGQLIICPTVNWSFHVSATMRRGEEQCSSAASAIFVQSMTIRVLSFRMPCAQVRRVQTMLNSKPRMRLKGLTANEALFGAPEACPLQPPAVIVANLLQLDRWADRGCNQGCGTRSGGWGGHGGGGGRGGGLALLCCNQAASQRQLP